MKALLYDIAHARSGDKGDTVNVGIIARRPEYWEFMRSYVTAERVKQHFGDMVKGVFGGTCQAIETGTSGSSIGGSVDCS